MKGSNIPVDNVAKNLQIRIMLQSTEEQFMMGSNILVDNVGNNSLRKEVYVDI